MCPALSSAHSRLAVDVSFTAPEPREFIFNLHCNVKTKTTPLSINVKAVGHFVDVGVSITDSKGEETMLTSKEGDAVKKVDFGKVSKTSFVYCLPISFLNPYMYIHTDNG